MDKPVEEGCSVGLSAVAGVVSLADEDGLELDAGSEVAAGLARGLHAAVELDGAGAEPVAEHAGVCFAAEPGHGGRLVVGGKLEHLDRPVHVDGLQHDEVVQLARDVVDVIGTLPSDLPTYLDLGTTDRWLAIVDDTLTCPHCGGAHILDGPFHDRGAWRCLDCGATPQPRPVDSLAERGPRLTRYRLFSLGHTFRGVSTCGPPSPLRGSRGSPTRRRPPAGSPGGVRVYPGGGVRPDVVGDILSRRRRGRFDAPQG